ELFGASAAEVLGQPLRITPEGEPFPPVLKPGKLHVGKKGEKGEKGARPVFRKADPAGRHKGRRHPLKK
ncbi:MAG: hypothetical protein KJ041_11155, partial [Gammaproteobacteria bacterium]|nr:hypothetical protein [Gammaproteobacteria bacterium]